MNKYEERYYELKKMIQLARDKKSLGRTIKDDNIILDAESTLDFHNGALNELMKWFGHQITFNK
jgi:hypothetical protein